MLSTATVRAYRFVRPLTVIIDKLGGAAIDCPGSPPLRPGPKSLMQSHDNKCLTECQPFWSSISKAFSFRARQPHDLHPRIHEKNVAGNAAAQIAGQKYRSISNFRRISVAS